MCVGEMEKITEPALHQNWTLAGKIKGSLASQLTLFAVVMQSLCTSNVLHFWGSAQNPLPHNSQYPFSTLLLYITESQICVFRLKKKAPNPEYSWKRCVLLGDWLTNLKVGWVLHKSSAAWLLFTSGYPCAHISFLKEQQGLCCHWQISYCVFQSTTAM